MGGCGGEGEEEGEVSGRVFFLRWGGLGLACGSFWVLIEWNSFIDRSRVPSIAEPMRGVLRRRGESRQAVGRTLDIAAALCAKWCRRQRISFDVVATRRSILA